jgi:hypothetical protein
MRLLRVRVRLKAKSAGGLHEREERLAFMFNAGSEANKLKRAKDPAMDTYAWEPKAIK